MWKRRLTCEFVPTRGGELRPWYSEEIGQGPCRVSFDFLTLPSDYRHMPGEPMRRERRPAIRDFDADAIRAAITLLGMTDTAVAEETGLPLRTLGAWTRGEVVPTKGKVQKLIDYMGRRGISVDDAIRAAHGDTGPQLDLVEQAILNDEQLPMRLRKQLIQQRRAMLGDDEPI